MWNSLPSSVVSSKTIEEFKAQIYIIGTKVLHRNSHLALTLKSLCMVTLKGNDEELINNHHRTFPATYGSLAIINLFFVSSF